MVTATTMTTSEQARLDHCSIGERVLPGNTVAAFKWCSAAFVYN